MILLVGPSASGKTEIAKELFNLYKIKKVITHTTRDKRVGEVNGIDYHFVSKDEFLSLKENDYFVETTIYNDNYYGTSKVELQDDKVIVVDPNGKNTFAALNNPHIVIFYIHANDELRKERMISRGDSEENIAQRLKKDKEYFSDSKKNNSDYIIINENKSLQEVSEEIYKLYIKKLSQ